MSVMNVSIRRGVKEDENEKDTRREKQRLTETGRVRRGVGREVEIGALEFTGFALATIQKQERK